jgi:hypothetical protein
VQKRDASAIGHRRAKHLIGLHGHVVGRNEDVGIGSEQPVDGGNIDERLMSSVGLVSGFTAPSFTAWMMT